ncbi:PTS system, N-acetylgalactosamine-specific IIA component [Clostridium cavendishii DSM 21758]|uniref:PTS system, N-acetylgalactosamine-specific IIA component n=1 Tax=Clostridium cavendishii DSM 21758 TaxID=1121302 RepID=A0A1M6H3D1_9CLOT|nr:PTS galactosamine/N-acetylgalactosamine transporter subunit IIA [Clostridium cavendishii]SHJ16690.1 PTS system, N-acetylgalactosamine-specific IIA component [Clostridium cavendishii DSM 21758]
MVGIIVTGHGNFATGLLSSMKLIAGEQQNVVGIDFTEQDTTETLEEKLVTAVSNFESDVLMLCDLAGGSPFRVAALLKNSTTNKNIEVISGTNLPMLLETALMSNGMKLYELASFAINSGNEGIAKFENKKREVIEDESDGI